MKVSEALARRKSIRDFLGDEIPQEVLMRVLERAAQAPSGGNLQPWHIFVLRDGAMTRWRDIVAQAVKDHPKGQKPEYRIYPADLREPYCSRRFQVGEDMYARLGVPREDRAARLRWFGRNFEFFGAPVAIFCFIDRQMGPPQWSDLGMYLQTVMLLLQEEGWDSCAQEAWALFAGLVRETFRIDGNLMLFCGMAIGKARPGAAVNDLTAGRATPDEYISIL